MFILHRSIVGSVLREKAIIRRAGSLSGRNRVIYKRRRYMISVIMTFAKG
jgi:hypothetical protein